jgi:hypothetical protein
MVKQGTYTRNWQRQFTSTLAANLIRLNFVDRGPGYMYYELTLQLVQWKPGTIGYKAGITQTVIEQMQNLENSYMKISTPIPYLDPLGNSPEGNANVYFTNLVQTFPQFSTSENVYIEVQIELTEAVGLTIT